MPLLSVKTHNILRLYSPKCLNVKKSKPPVTLVLFRFEDFHEHINAHFKN